MSDIDYDSLSIIELRVLLARRDFELDEWRKLLTPVALHQNLMRGKPARLDTNAFLHLAGATDYPHTKECLAQAKALLVDSARILQDSIANEDQHSNKARHLLRSIETFLKLQ